MDDQNKQPKSISEISHLFLSSLREKQTGDAPKPMRIPPQQQQQQQAPAPQPIEDDLTPEEYEQVNLADGESDQPRIAPISAVIASHFDARSRDRVREYARHVAANGQRVGVIELDAAEFRLTCFERSIEPNQGDPNPAAPMESFDHRVMSEALAEMAWDVDRWLLVLANPRSPEARAMLKDVEHWTLLCTCDHDGVVSCYRTLKGLANISHPKMTLALLDAAAEAHAAKIFQKLGSVCLQFLGIELGSEPAVRSTRAVAEHVVAHCRPTKDKAALASQSQWLVVTEFLARAKAQPAMETSTQPQISDSEISNPKSEISNFKSEIPMHTEFTSRNPEPPEVETVMPVSPVRDEPLPPAPIQMPVQREASDEVSEVIDLPAEGEQAILSAILGGAKGDLLECPVRPPMCPDARLAVTRDRGLVLMAVASKGLRELRLIAQAYRWLNENRGLIGMAVPQLAIDAHRHPRLRLLVDHADMTAEVLAPMLESGTVSVQAYRKLRWGGKTGLLLEAA